MTCCVRPRYAYLLQWRCLSSSACCVIAVSMQQLASAGRWHGWMRMCGCRRTMPLPCTQQQQQQHWPDRQACEHCTNGALSGDSAHATCSVFPSVSAVSSPSRSSQSLDQTGVAHSRHRACFTVSRSWSLDLCVTLLPLMLMIM